ncbi:hypothetical protein L1987_41032 [Smallanthus sonchifolius]|uniref:Uncharacterized protein n=1 Tax=Smallanthus sonchifolius TaxID=185202 RepID=A0ACB9GV23_9ASTR|nr:hypothetical protein L1987_41032 [Smallanthus sonchifolius]
MVYKLYNSEMGVKGFVYDGEKTSFTVGLLPGTKLEFPVLLENLSSNRTVCCGSPNTGETKRSRFHLNPSLHEAVRVLGVLLRQHAVKQIAKGNHPVTFAVAGCETQYVNVTVLPSFGLFEGSSVTAKEMWGKMEQDLIMVTLIRAPQFLQQLGIGVHKSVF